MWPEEAWLGRNYNHKGRPDGDGHGYTTPTGAVYAADRRVSRALDRAGHSISVLLETYDARPRRTANTIGHSRNSGPGCCSQCPRVLFTGDLYCGVVVSKQ